VTVPGPAAVNVQSDGTAVPPVAPLSTVFTNVSVAGWSAFVNVHTVSEPNATVTLGLDLLVGNVTPPDTQTNDWKSYPDGPPDSPNPKIPGRTLVRTPVGNTLVPADNVQSVGTAVPPCVFCTSFTNVK
jgi:hypothetical protein